MPRPKGAKNKTTRVAPAIDPRVEEMYETTVEFTCPVRGKVKQRVWVKRFRDNATDFNSQVVATKDPVAEIENGDDGLSIYSEDELDTENQGRPPVASEE